VVSYTTSSAASPSTTACASGAPKYATPPRDVATKYTALASPRGR
jgi:hypothetical protein